MSEFVDDLCRDGARFPEYLVASLNEIGRQVRRDLANHATFRASLQVNEFWLVSHIVRQHVMCVPCVRVIPNS